jgi:hypothetical protein
MKVDQDPSPNSLEVADENHDINLVSSALAKG